MSLALENPMVVDQCWPERNLELVVVDTRKRDALENALFTLDSLADDLMFDEANEVVHQINKAYAAAEKALAEMEG